MISNKYDVALLVHSCDRYELLFKGFEFFFSKHWNFTIKCQRYFATEKKEVSLTGFENLLSGNGAWADRLSLLLQEKITEKYILYFQEDMWINKKVDADFFNQLFSFVLQNNLKQVKLHSSEVYTTQATDRFIKGFNVSKVSNSASDFLMSHQVTLWDKEFLLEQLHKGEHPWRNERKATQRLRKLNADIYHVDYFAENGNKEINKNSSPVATSEYYTVSVNGVLSSHILPYIEELKRSEKHLEYGQKLQYNYVNHLTHDGLQKPRKVDIFKRFKNWIVKK